MFVVTVWIEVTPESWEAFLPLMQENAQASVREEPDCMQFDVCSDPSRPNAVFLYEVYTDAAAFQTHLLSAHFKTFDAAVAEMTVSKQVQTFDRVDQA